MSFTLALNPPGPAFADNILNAAKTSLHFNNPKFKSLPNNKISDWSYLKACADDKRYVTENWKFVW